MCEVANRNLYKVSQGKSVVRNLYVSYKELENFLDILNFEEKAPDPLQEHLTHATR